MPYKHNESRRHKITKSRYKVTNWPEYNEALRRRGDFTICFTEDAIAGWRPAKTGAMGRHGNMPMLRLKLRYCSARSFVCRYARLKD